MKFESPIAGPVIHGRTSADKLALVLAAQRRRYGEAPVWLSAESQRWSGRGAEEADPPIRTAAKASTS